MVVKKLTVELKWGQQPMGKRVEKVPKDVT